MKYSEIDYRTKMKGGLGTAFPWSPSEGACPGQFSFSTQYKTPSTRTEEPCVSFTVSAE
jgi:hypothetical protein